MYKRLLAFAQKHRQLSDAGFYQALEALAFSVFVGSLVVLMAGVVIMALIAMSVKLWVSL